MKKTDYKPNEQGRWNQCNNAMQQEKWMGWMGNVACLPATFPEPNYPPVSSLVYM
jgi:hypothetical protein